MTVHLNGVPATVEDLAPLAFASYAHLTAMQVRGGRVRGLDLHLTRLREASEQLFAGQALPDYEVRAYLRNALDAEDLSLVITIHVPEFTASTGRPGVLVRTGPPATGPKGPLALKTVAHERIQPTVKHVGEMAKTHYLRQAVAEGYDDAVFVDRRRRLSEGTIWNLAFWDGTTVIWPDADKLTGVTMGIVRRQLDELGVPQRVQEITDPAGLKGAVVMNSWTPGVPVHRIDETRIPEAPTFVELLHRAYEAEPLTSP